MRLETKQIATTLTSTFMNPVGFWDELEAFEDALVLLLGAVVE